MLVKNSTEDNKEKTALPLTIWKKIILFSIGRPAHSSSLLKQNQVRNVFLHVLNNLFSSMLCLVEDFYNSIPLTSKRNTVSIFL